MALKNCLYCGKSISEHASFCPNCNSKAPFDENLKNQKDKEIMLKVKAIETLERSKNCAECGSPIKIQDILSGNSCISCGYPGAYIKCEKCDEKASFYISEYNHYVCEKHLQSKCKDCGISYNNREMIFVYKKYGESYYYCITCAKKYPGLKDSIALLRRKLYPQSGCLTTIIFLSLFLFVVTFLFHYTSHS